MFQVGWWGPLKHLSLNNLKERMGKSKNCLYGGGGGGDLIVHILTKLTPKGALLIKVTWGDLTLLPRAIHSEVKIAT